MSTFVFEAYSYADGVARFHYRQDDLSYTEEISFDDVVTEYDKEAFERALFLAFVLVGASYYKCFPAQSVRFEQGSLDEWQANFYNETYREGLSQFAYENQLDPAEFAVFTSTIEAADSAVHYEGEGDVAMQSGGKDSLLLATMLQERGRAFTPWYCSTSDKHPSVLDDLPTVLIVSKRTIDRQHIAEARARGGLNGHVPVTYILSSIAILEAILRGKVRVLTAIGHEGEEPHAYIGDTAVRHQWSKTWPAEQAMAEYVKRYISPDIMIFSPLRRYSELRIAELFVEQAWEKYGHHFSSCNLANYMQGQGNTTLTWCGECPKCANSYLLFAPFLNADELQSLFGGKDMFTDQTLDTTFRGLLGIEGTMKPFECVGEIDELRRAYHMAQQRGGYGQLSFEVPESNFDYKKEYTENGGSI